MVGRWWFFVEDVGCVASEFSGVKGCDDVGLVNEFATAGVEEPGVVRQEV